jgi:hypothetical protein
LSLGPLVAISLLLAQAPGQDAAPAAPPPLQRRPLAVGASVVPGLVLHGSGHFVAGDRRTALRLLVMEGIGIGAVGTGALILGATGVSRWLAGGIIATTVAGAGLFAISALADIYGVLAPAGGTGAPPDYLPSIQAELGTRYIYDPQFQYRAFLGPALEVRRQSWRLHGSGWLALDDDNQRLRLLGAYRLTRFVEVALAVTHHHYGAEGFDTEIAEGAVQGRYHMSRLSPTLAGSFAEGGVGWGLALDRYGADASERRTLLLARFGYGIYLGEPNRGELVVYYDHRTDDYAGHLKTPGLQSGQIGHFGVHATAYLSEGWGARGEAQVGSAYIAGLSVVYRYGATL